MGIVIKDYCEMYVIILEDLFHINRNFLSSCEPGAATVLTEGMSSSRQFDRFQASLNQNGKERIRAFGTFANEHNDCVL